MAFRSGFVAILGRPNAGKSTLLNALLGEKLAIVTPKAQTTRTRVLGVLEQPVRKATKTRPAQPAAQIVLVDTPGVHKPSSQLDRRMMQEVHDALEGRDAVLFLVDARESSRQLQRPAKETDSPVKTKQELATAEDAFALSLLRNVTCPVILVLNKIDLVRREELLPLITHWTSRHTFAETMLISASKHDGLDELLQQIVALLPDGQRYFPADQLTDQPMRFLAAELIREKILLHTGEEVPYASAVIVEQWEDPKPQLKKPTPGTKPPLTRIGAAIYVERSGQKAILIGKGGTMLKTIGTAARREIESLTGTRVFLELFVKVREDWRSQRGFVEELDWRRQLEALTSKPTAAE